MGRLWMVFLGGSGWVRDYNEESEIQGEYINEGVGDMGTNIYGIKKKWKNIVKNNYPGFSLQNVCFKIDVVYKIGLVCKT